MFQGAFIYNPIQNLSLALRKAKRLIQKFVARCMLQACPDAVCYNWLYDFPSANDVIPKDVCEIACYISTHM